MTERMVTAEEWMTVVRKLDLARELREKASGNLPADEKLAIMAAIKVITDNAAKIGVAVAAEAVKRDGLETPERDAANLLAMLGRGKGIKYASKKACDAWDQPVARRQFHWCKVAANLWAASRAGRMIF